MNKKNIPILFKIELQAAVQFNKQQTGNLYKLYIIIYFYLYFWICTCTVKKNENSNQQEMRSRTEVRIKSFLGGVAAISKQSMSHLHPLWRTSFLVLFRSLSLLFLNIFCLSHRTCHHKRSYSLVTNTIPWRELLNPQNIKHFSHIDMKYRRIILTTASHKGEQYHHCKSITRLV